MVNASSSFKTALANDKRKYLRYADIALANGTVLHITNENLYQNGMSIEDSTSDDNNFEVGAFMIGKLTLVLNNMYGTYTNYIFEDGVVVAYVGLQLSNGVEKLRKGTFLIKEAKGQNSSLVTLDCLDYGCKFNRPYSQSTLSYPATLGAILRDACTNCNVVCNADTFTNSTYVIAKRPDDSNLTFGGVVSAVAQIACKYVKLNPNGNLVLGWYTDGDSNPHHISSMQSHNITMDDVVISGVSVSTGAGKEDVTALEGTRDYVVEVSGNPLVTADNAAEIAHMMGQQLIGLTFRPMTLSILSDPTIEAGDSAIVTDRKGKTYKTYINNLSWTVGNYQTVSCEAETPARNSAKRASEAAKTYARLKDELEDVKSAFDLAYEDLVSRIENASGFYETEEVQQDGSVIYYQHNKPLLADSDIIWKETGETRAVSTDGGKTWNAGITADGNAILQKLSAHGINADWINAGELDAQYINAKGLSVSDSNNNNTLYIDDDGNVNIRAASFSLAGKAISEVAEEGMQDLLVTSVDIEYGLSANKNTAPSTWGTTATWEKDKFLWTRNKITFEDNSVAYSAARLLVEDNGVGVAGVVEQYYLSTSNSSVTGGTWVDICPEWVNGRCYWTRSKITWSDGSVTYTTPTPYNGLTSGNQSTADLDAKLNSTTEIFNRLTQNGTVQGLFMENGQLYVNMSYLRTGILQVLKDNVERLYVDGDTGTVRINADSFSLTNGQTLASVLSDAQQYVDDKLVEFASENLLLDTANLSSTYWVIEGGTGTWEQTDPFGGTKALLLTPSNTNCRLEAKRANNNPFKTTGVSYRFTVWLKASNSSGASNPIKLYFNNTASENIYPTTSWKQYTMYLDNVSSVASSYRVAIGGQYSFSTEDGYNLYIAYPEVIYYHEYTQDEIMNLLTAGDLTNQGIYLLNGRIYINMSYLNTGKLTIRNPTTLATTFSADASTGDVDIVAKSFRLVSGETLASTLQSAKDYIDSLMLATESDNLLKGSLDFSEDYWRVTGTLTGNYSDPKGGRNAFMLAYPSSGESGITALSTNKPFPVTGVVYRLSVWLRSSNSTNASNHPIGLYLNETKVGEVSPTTKWKEYHFDLTVASVSSVGWVNIGGNNTFTYESGWNCYIYNPRVKIVTDSDVTKESIFNAVTDNGANNGVFLLSNGQLYINATYINTGTFCGWKISSSGKQLDSPGYTNENGNGIRIDAANNRIICKSYGEKYNHISTFGASGVDGPRGLFDYVELGSPTYATDTEVRNYLRIGSYTKGDSYVNSDVFKMYGLRVTNSEIYVAISGGSGTEIVGYSSSSMTSEYRLRLSTSSKRFKNHVRDFTVKEAEALYNLPVVVFKYKPDHIDKTDEWFGKEIPGLYAEDVEKVLPIAATHDPDGNVISYNYRPILASLIKLVQDLHEKELRAEKRIVDLETKVENQEERIAKLEAMIEKMVKEA